MDRGISGHIKKFVDGSPVDHLCAMDDAGIFGFLGSLPLGETSPPEAFACFVNHAASRGLKMADEALKDAKTDNFIKVLTLINRFNPEEEMSFVATDFAINSPGGGRNEDVRVLAEVLALMRPEEGDRDVEPKGAALH